MNGAEPPVNVVFTKPSHTSAQLTSLNELIAKVPPFKFPMVAVVFAVQLLPSVIYIVYVN